MSDFNFNVSSNQYDKVKKAMDSVGNEELDASKFTGDVNSIFDSLNEEYDNAFQDTVMKDILLSIAGDDGIISEDELNILSKSDGDDTLSMSDFDEILYIEEDKTTGKKEKVQKAKKYVDAEGNQYSYTYNEDGTKKTRTKIFKTDGSVLESEYIRDEKGKKIRSIAKKLDNEGNLKYTTEIEYDSKGRRLKVTTKNPKGKIKSDSEYNYIDNGDGSVTQRKTNKITGEVTEEPYIEDAQKLILKPLEEVEPTDGEDDVTPSVSEDLEYHSYVDEHKPERVNDLDVSLDMKDLVEGAEWAELLTVNGDKVFNDDDLTAFFENYDPKRPDAASLNKLLSLVEAGKVPTSVFSFVPEKGTLPENIQDEVNKMYDAILNGKDLKDVFVPTYKDIDKAMSEQKIGDVFEVEGEKNIYIKTNDEQGYKQLEISKDTYFKLFPPVERYTSAQNDIGNCWELTGINAVLSDPEQRDRLLSCFKEDGDDILISFPNGKYESIRFTNGELPADINKDAYSLGALGVNLLEYADGKEIQKAKIEQYIEEHPEAARWDQEKLENAWLYEDNSGRIQYKGSYDNLKASKNYNMEEKYGDVITQNRNGGNSYKLFDLLGYNNAKYVYKNDADYSKLLRDPATFENNMVAVDTILLGDFKVGDIDEAISYGIGPQHAYRIKPGKIVNGQINTYKLVNPWGSMEVELSYNQMAKFFRAIEIAEK